MAKNNQTKQKQVVNDIGAIESGAKIERLRDLIFGEQIKTYKTQFSNMRRDISKLQTELTRLSTDLHEQQKLLLRKLQEQEETLAGQLQEQDKRHSQLTRDVDDRLSQQIHDLGRKQNEALDDLRQNLRQLEETSHRELQEILHSLDNSKMDRLTLGTLLSNLGATLKQEGPDHEAVSLVDELTLELDDS